MTERGTTPRPRRLLLTGAAGRIGRAFFLATRTRYQFRLVDRGPLPFVEGEDTDAEEMQLDVADLAACQRACAGMDTVLHLAGDPRSTAGFYESLLENNIQATYNIFQAAKDQGCRRVIFASSIQVMRGYPKDVQLAPDAPLRPVNMYGVSKCFGEAVAAYFAQAHGLSSIVVRIGGYDADQPQQWLRSRPDVRDLTTYVSRRDLQQLLLQCIETPDIPFAIVHGVSENRFKRLDLTATRDLLGYAPQDDAFHQFSEQVYERLKDAQ